MRPRDSSRPDNKLTTHSSVRLFSFYATSKLARRNATEKRKLSGIAMQLVTLNSPNELFLNLAAYFGPLHQRNSEDRSAKTTDPKARSVQQKNRAPPKRHYVKFNCGILITRPKFSIGGKVACASRSSESGSSFSGGIGETRLVDKSTCKDRNSHVAAR